VAVRGGGGNSSSDGYQTQNKNKTNKIRWLSPSLLVFPSFFELVDVIETDCFRGHGDCTLSISLFNGADSVGA
jgi:hypothetical protein